MVREEIKNSILNFVIQDKVTPAQYASALFKDYKSLDDILDSLKEMLKDSDDNIFTPASYFFVYLMNNTGKIPGTKDDIFSEIVEDDYEIFKILENQLRSPNYYIRKTVINILSHLQYEASLEFITGAFDHYLMNDPVNLPLMISGMIKLADDIPWDYIDKIVKNSDYLVRWSFMEIIGNINLDYDYLYKYLELLKKDSNQKIQAEGAFWFDYFKELENDKNSDVFNERFEELKNRNRPEINYEVLIQNFSKMLEQKNQINYTVKELDEFAVSFC